MDKGDPQDRAQPDWPDSEGAKLADRDLVFYYSRSRRLERASAAVRALNDETPGKRPNLFRTLTATKAHTMLFISIVLLSVMVLIASLFTPRRDTVLGGNALNFSAFRYQGSTVVIIKKTVKNEKNPYTGAVDMAVSRPAGPEEPAADIPIAARRIFFTLEPNEEYRVALPFEAPELVILMRAEENHARLRIKTE
jgi:hypothetical protein